MAIHQLVPITWDQYRQANCPRWTPFRQLQGQPLLLSRNRSRRSYQHPKGV